MSGKILATILLAAGVATSKPISSPYVFERLSSRQDASPVANACANSGSSMILALSALESRAREELTQIETDRPAANAGLGNSEISDAQQLVLQQVNQALLVDHQANAANNEMDNVLRAVALAQQEPTKSTVLLVVQEVQVNVELERQANARMFKQEAVVANRGKQETETIMVYDHRTLTAIDVAVNPAATVPANASLPKEVVATKTIAAVLYDAKPTYAQIMEDPATSMREALEAAIQDRQKHELRVEDGEINHEVALMIKEETEEKKKKDDNGDDNEKLNDKELEKERKKQQEAEQQELDQEREREREEKKNAEKELEEQKKQAEKEAKKEKQSAEQETKEKKEAEKEAEKEKQLAELEAERERQQLEKEAKQQKQMEKEAEKEAEEEKQKAEEEAAQDEKKALEQQDAEQQQQEQEKKQTEQQAEKEKQQAEDGAGNGKQQAEAEAEHDEIQAAEQQKADAEAKEKARVEVEAEAKLKEAEHKQAVSGAME